MNKRIFFLIKLIFLVYTAGAIRSVAQTHTIDSLQNILNTQKEDTAKVNVLISLADHVWNAGYYSISMQHATNAKALAENLNYKSGLAGAYNIIGIIYMAQSNYPKALESFFMALKIREDINDKKGYAGSLNSIGALYWNQGEPLKALPYFFKSLKINEGIKDKDGMANSLNNIGIIYANDSQEQKALEYYAKALAIEQEAGNKLNIANTLNNIGNVYWNLDDLDKALHYQLDALKIKEEIKDKQGIALSLVNIGGIYSEKNEHRKSIEHFKKSVGFAREIGSWAIVKEGERQLSKTYDVLNDKTNAFLHYKLYIAARDSIFNEENTKKIVQSEMNFEFEKQKNADKLLHQKKEALHYAALRVQKTQRNAFIVGFSLVLALAVVSIRGYKQKQKANSILSLQNKEINIQKQVIETKNKDITDSIKYAKRIQEAILPPDKIWADILPDSFVFYKPKDILSGDFYWIEQDEDAIYVAAVDCTGHGVPGALMSVVGYNLLNKAVLEQNLIKPSQILDQLNKWLSITLHQSMSDSTVRDGMDISLCRIDKTKKVLEFAAAFNSLYHIRNGVLNEIKGNKFPVGIFIDEVMRNFVTHEVPLQKGDVIYLFTDGYADQFGGDQGKKFKYAKLKELFLAISNKPMSEQKEILNETFETWKGNLEQVDDVCIIGVRV